MWFCIEVSWPICYSSGNLFLGDTKFYRHVKHQVYLVLNISSNQSFGTSTYSATFFVFPPPHDESQGQWGGPEQKSKYIKAPEKVGMIIK